MTTTITIRYRRRVAARAGAERFHLAAHIQALPDGHPDKRVVAFMALYAREILLGTQPGTYTDTDALTFARLALVDPDTWAAHHHLDDDQLAAVLKLPTDQIPAARRDQARIAARSSRPGHRSSQDRAERVPRHAQTAPGRTGAVSVPAMTSIQIIELHGQPAAIVAGDLAIIATHITGADRARVQAKALYAIEIGAGQRPGPYTDQDAERFADAAATPCLTRAEARGRTSQRVPRAMRHRRRPRQRRR